MTAARAGRVLSPALRAPHRFNLVGLRWRGRAEPRLTVRVRRDGRRWSRWQALEAHADHNPDPRSGERSVAASDPLWVGEADQVQYALSRRVPGLRLHFVNVNGTATAGERVTTALRRVANTAVGTVAAALGGADAHAQGDEPAVVTRGASGAPRSARRAAAPSYGTVRAAYVHHTVSLNDYSPDEAPGIVLAICRYHRNSNGWNDIGYQALVDKYGVLYEGRAGGLDKPVLGAHAQGYNAQSTGIASIGDNSSVGLSDTALDSLADYIRWKLTIHGQPLSGQTTLVSAGGATSRYPGGQRVRVPRVLGHRDTNSTACPGSALYSQLDDLRARVSTGEALPGVATFLSAVALALACPLRAGLHAERHAHLQRAGPDRRAAACACRCCAAGAGARSPSRSPTPPAPGPRPSRREGTRILRAIYAGDGLWRRSFSPEQLVRVAPLVELDPTAALAVRGRRVGVRGQRDAAQAARLPGAPAAHPRRLPARGRAHGPASAPARFRSSFTPSFAGYYRVYVLAAADAATARGRSPLHVVRVARR